MTVLVQPEPAAQLRRFNRFYTRRLGLLGEHFLESPYSLAESRVLYEIGHRTTATAAVLRAELGLDAGYLSRILRRLQADGMVARRRDEADRRQYGLWLTDAGRALFARLEARAQADATAMLDRLSPAEQDRLVDAMAMLQRRLQDAPADADDSSIVLRPHRVGDMGWIVHRTALIYAETLGWTGAFEGVFAEIVGRFLTRFDPARERAWIAERDGTILGAVFLARDSDAVARLRMLYVEPAARGHGVGTRLVDACIAFARASGYRRIVLWTYDMLASARRIYQAAGFALVDEVEEDAFGHRMRSQSWALEL
ncbi:MAG: helix-turn-helix domain-containing GNAT family N-acetyltransferase [Alphaproteobacteria bacterium]